MENAARAPYFELADGLFIPRPHARSPWSNEMLHGRVLAGLLARQIELEHGDPAFLVTRLTVDMFRTPPLKPVEVQTRLTRDGNRIRAIEGSIRCEGVEIARASAVMLRKSEQPEGEVWKPPVWNMPHPETLPAPEVAPNSMLEMRGGKRWNEGPLEQKRTWAREVGLLVEGEELTPLVRVALLADFVSPFANGGIGGLNYLNADVTLYLHRLPVTDWLGVEVAGHQAADGIAVGDCTLYDVDGPIGRATCCAVANRRSGPPR